MRQGSHPLHQRGQISILMIFTLIPLFTLFAFVVNVGMLVNAKISLQNAADFAAYAGAAAQARQLTQISHLNYQMRQTYKKFLFRYYIMGNLSLRCFPRDGAPDPACTSTPQTVFDWQNRDRTTGGTTGFPGMPIVCLSLSTQSNPCQLDKPIPLVKPPACAPLDPVCNQLQNAAKQIADIQSKSCDANSVINAEVLSHWLFATDPEAKINTNINLQGLIDDFGLVTEELLLKSRINVLKSYVNHPPGSDLTLATIRSKYDGLADQASAERTSLAYKTAYNNLNEEVFDKESVEMTELLPKGVDLLQLKTIEPRFDVGYSRMENPGGSGGDCRINIEFFRNIQPVVGVYKTPESYVYYAVKLKAKAQLLFNPFPFGSPADRIELTAYAAAAPFGSRIGPVIPEETLTKKFNPMVADPSGALKTEEHVGPWMKILEDGTKTWDSVDVLKSYHTALAGPAGAGALAVGKADYQRGIYSATLPEEQEVGKYNIPVDTDRIGMARNGRPTHEMIPYFRPTNDSGTSAGGADPAMYTFWAPIAPIGGQDEFSQQMDAELDKVSNMSFGTSQGAGPGGAPSSTQSARFRLKDLLKQGMDKTFVRLRERLNYNIARIPDPLSMAFFNQAYPPIPGKVTAPVKIATSYTTDHDYNYYENGRDGYSVKFIPFRMILAQPGRLTNIGQERKWRPVDDALGGERTELLKVAH